jgi:hypothetical protein
MSMILIMEQGRAFTFDLLGWLVGLNFSPISEQKYFGIYGIAHICYGIFSTMCLSSVSLKALIVVVFWLLVFAIARVKDAAV